MCPPTPSPRGPSLAVSLAGVAAVIAVMLALGLAGCGTQLRQAGPARPAASASSAPSPASVAPGTASRAEQATAVKVARGWITHWLRPPAQVASGQWVAGLAGLSTPEAVIKLRTVDPQNNPATRITGPPRVHAALRDDVTVDVPTDAGPVRVVVVNDGGRWLVNSWDEAS